MGMDKFIASGTTTINRGQETALFPLIRTVGLIVGQESPATSEQFDEDLKEKLSMVEVNGTVLWDLSKDVTTIKEDDIEEWSPATKKKLKEAKNCFKDFTHTHFSSSKVEKSIYGLNRDVLRSAAWEMLSTNYQLFGKSFHFTINMPPSPNAELKLKRKDNEEGCFLSLEFSASVYEAFDYNQLQLLGLNHRGELQVIDQGNFTEVPDTENWQKICEIQLNVTIYLANVPTPEPEVTIEITVRSDCSKFRYVGGWALEIKQLENVDVEPVIPLLSIVASNSNPRELTIEDPQIMLLENSNRQIGIMIERIISIQSRSLEELPISIQLLSSILNLFNEALKIHLLKAGSTYNYLDTHNIQLSVFNFKNVMTEMLEAQDVSPEYLAQQVQSELSLIFYKLSDIQISNLLTIFHGSFLFKIRESAIFICKNPEFFLKARGYIVSADKLSRINYIIATAIQCIHSSLKNTQQRKNIEMIGFSQSAISITNIEEVPSVFQQYLYDVVLNKIKDNPLREQLMINMNLSNLFLPSTLEDSSDEEHSVGTSLQNINDDQEYRLLHIQLPVPKRRLGCCPGGPSEKTAALWERNPVIKGLNDGSAIYFTLRQLLTVYPTVRVAVLPYLTLVNIAGGIIGMSIGMQAILHPNRSPNAFVRIWEATTNGLIVCVFSMGSAITIYLAIRPEDTYVSDLVFWTQIASVPIILSGAHTIWHTIPHKTKEQYFSVNNLCYNTKKGLDVLAKFLFYAGITDISLLNLAKLPPNPIYQIIPPIIATFLALGHLTPFRERLNVGMIYLTAINFSYMLIETLITGEIPPAWSYTQMAFWIVTLIPSIYFTLRNAVNFEEKYEQPPEIIVRAVPKSWWDPETNNTTINAQQYNHLRQLPALENTGEKTQLVTFAKQLHDKNYATINPLPPKPEEPSDSSKRRTLGALDWCGFT